MFIFILRLIAQLVERALDKRTASSSSLLKPIYFNSDNIIELYGI